MSEKSKSKVRGRRAGRGKEKIAGYQSKRCWKENGLVVCFFFFCFDPGEMRKKWKMFWFWFVWTQDVQKKRKEKPLHQDFGWVVRLFKATSNFFFACFLFFFCCSFPGKEGRNSSIRQRATEGLKEVCKVK